MSYKLTTSAEIDTYLNMMLYGLPGSGKTMAAATMQLNPETTGVLILSVEGGMLSLRGVDWEDYGPPGVIEVSDMQVLDEIFWALQGNSEELSQFRTVVMDSLTEIGTKDLEHTVGRNLNKTTRAGKKRESVDDAWLEDRGEVTMRQARIVRGFRDMPRNFIATAHPRITYSKNDDGMPNVHLPPTKVEPGFGDRLRQHLCGYMDHVWYMQEGNGTYHDILTKTKGPYYAKSRAEGWTRFGEVIRWPIGTPILSDIWETEINNQEWPDRYRLEEKK